MTLTGIAKEKFLSEYYKESIKNNWDLNELEYIFNMLPEACQNTLIIDWFDSLGIYIDIRIEFNDSFEKTFDSYAEDAYVGNYSNR